VTTYRDTDARANLPPCLPTARFQAHAGGGDLRGRRDPFSFRNHVHSRSNRTRSSMPDVARTKTLCSPRVLTFLNTWRSLRQPSITAALHASPAHSPQPLPVSKLAYDRMLRLARGVAEAKCPTPAHASPQTWGGWAPHLWRRCQELGRHDN
jgi:hypothetical protein